MLIEANFICAVCGEAITTSVDPSGGIRQSYVEDCQVCCRPNLLHIEIDPQDPTEARIDAEPESPAHWWGAQSGAWFRLQGLSHYGFKGHFIHELPVQLDQFRIPPKEIEEMLPQQMLMLLVAARAAAEALPRIAEQLAGRDVVRVVFVPGRLINIVVR